MPGSIRMPGISLIGLVATAGEDGFGHICMPGILSTQGGADGCDCLG